MAQVRDTVGQVSSLQYSVNGIGERIESLQTSLTTLDAKTTDRVQEILCIIQELGEQVAVLQDVLLDITTAIEQEAAASGECNTNTVIIVNFDTTLQ
jgi:prefoldin subunit 5